jgi:DNA polymerase V
MSLLLDAFTKKVDKTPLVRRLGIAAQDTRKDDGTYQLDLSTDYDALDKERRLQRTLLEVRQKYGSNTLLCGFNYMNGGTARERNLQIGGHKA